MMSFTTELTIFPKAPPMMMPTARSTTFPLTANSLNSEAMDMGSSPFRIFPRLSQGAFSVRYSGVSNAPLGGKTEVLANPASLKQSPGK